MLREEDLRGIYQDYFTAIPAGERAPLPSISSREDPVRLRAKLIERVFCRSIGRRRRIGGPGRKKEKKEADEDKRERERAGGRGKPTRRDGVNGERKGNACCRHANSCWTAMWKDLVGSSDLTARNLVSDTINIGPEELSQSRGSLRGERESG